MKRYIVILRESNNYEYRGKINSFAQRWFLSKLPLGKKAKILKQKFGGEVLQYKKELSDFGDEAREYFKKFGEVHPDTEKLEQKWESNAKALYNKIESYKKSLQLGAK